MILGEAICCIGTGFFTTIDSGTSTVLWASLLVITGLGIGIGMQLPYTAVQVVLRCVCISKPLRSLKAYLQWKGRSHWQRYMLLWRLCRWVNLMILVWIAIAIFVTQLGGLVKLEILSWVWGLCADEPPDPGLRQSPQVRLYFGTACLKKFRNRQSNSTSSGHWSRRLWSRLASKVLRDAGSAEKGLCDRYWQYITVFSCCGMRRNTICVWYGVS